MFTHKLEVKYVLRSLFCCFHGATVTFCLLSASRRRAIVVGRVTNPPAAPLLVCLSLVSGRYFCVYRQNLCVRILFRDGHRFAGGSML
jgi:hypothetical protein